ncbi:MerR family transcriptional regulator [Nocardia beijingensis]|uniref:helix-turn-helix domain-containing protein n=1 Tax=Nocardia beijingensis TaxID=95162 RepID=UPI001894AEA8|nr:MerR family transcriptional regulator [Nocardia beijingensis]MBF6468115.1 MerR family transcriptional regulator [Nocardia beijingensis]
MRIGELARLVGVSTRTVRHYHYIGVLPEPERLVNGYREYGLRDAVLLARVRRLAELGLSLDEVRDVLADDQGRELREVLLELDTDLAGQQEALRVRREKLAGLLALADLDADPTLPPEAVAVVRSVAPGTSRFAEMDREMLALVSGLEQGSDFMELLKPLTEPEAVARSHALYARLDELQDAPTDDPRIDLLSRDLAAHLPAPVIETMIQNLDVPWSRTVLGEFSPAQAEVFERLVHLLKD